LARHILKLELSRGKDDEKNLEAFHILKRIKISFVSPFALLGGETPSQIRERSLIFNKKMFS
jgi:hypothetical protein